MKKEFLKTIGKTILEFNLLEPGDSVLAAVSGGPDSVALVLSLLSFKEKYGLELGIAHMNHLLRGEESSRDENFVKDFAKDLGLPFHILQKDIKKYAGNKRLSIEEAGREARYIFFEQTADFYGYTKIATGHTKDDNAELVLMNLLRGAGPKGLSGIPAIRDNKYIRPLIRVLKVQVFDFLKSRQQKFMIDSSNKDMVYLRNTVRHRLIPQIQSEYNPKIVDALERLSHILRQEENFWDIETEKQFNNCLVNMENNCIILSSQLVSNLHPAVLSRVLRKALWKVKKNLKRISLSHIDDMVKLCFKRSSGISLDLPGQIRVYKDKNLIIIKKEVEPLRVIGKRQKQSKVHRKKKPDKEL